MHRKQQRKDLKPVRLGSWWYIGGFMTHVGLGNEAIHFTKEHLSWGFQDNFVSDHSIGLWKKLKGWKLWALMFATVKTSVCLGGWGEINQHEQNARSACGDGDGKKDMPRLQGEESRLEPQLRHIGSDDPNFHLGIERGDWNPNEANSYSICGAIYLYPEFLPFEVTDFSKISQIKCE